MWLYSQSVSQTTGWSHAASGFRSHTQSRPRTVIDRWARSTQSPSVAIFSVRDCTTPRSRTSTISKLPDVDEYAELFDSEVVVYWTFTRHYVPAVVAVASMTFVNITV